MAGASGVRSKASRGGGLIGALLAFAVLACGAGGAHAEDSNLTLSPSAAQRCLFPPLADRVKPAYPEGMLRLKRGAAVEAKFTFTKPDGAPSVAFEGDVDGDFRDAVNQYAAQLRVPCMGQDGPRVTLKQGFDFVPNDGRKVAWTATVDVDDAAREKQLKCLAVDHDFDPQYPRKMQQELRQGVVVERVRFVAADKPPEVEMLDDSGSRQFGSAVSGYLSALRLPCMGNTPVETTYHFVFRIEGASTRVLKDLGLQDFLVAIQPFPAGSAYFDTTAMKCPFDVRLTLRQPYEQNEAAELEEDVPARHAFLDWLAQRQLDIAPRVANSLFKQTMLIHVPCAVVNL